MVKGLPKLGKDFPTCVACQYEKLSRLPFQQSKAWRATQKLQLIYTDVGGLMNTSSINGSMYYVAFIDNYSRMCWFYFMKFKVEIANIFGKFKTWIETQSNCKIQVIISDNETEYTSETFNRFYEDAGIEHQLTTSYSA